MTALRDLEHHFLGHVLGKEVFPRIWCGQGIVDSDVGLAIYANAYHSRLREALESDHPILSRYLGDSLWEAFCTGYIEAHPSRVRSLRNFGAKGPNWLRENEPFSNYPAIAELAAFERLLLDAFDAADAPRLSWADIQSLDAADWPELQIGFHPSVRLLKTSSNAIQIWRALKDELDPPAAGPSASPAHLLWRDDERISRFRPVDSIEGVALQASLVEKKSFSTLCEALLQDNPGDEVPILAVGCIRRWCDEGIIEKVSSE